MPENKDKRPSFEEAFSGLEKAAGSLRNEGTGLEEAIKNFEEGIGYYKLCSEILSDAKQKIESYSVEKETQEV
ncbi:MAG: exodeoxyribonuclease VII small subunit [Clostridia bacterium]|nr:exodeoxyribonuclease VII small subunit [Clostridia bacterium]